MPAPRAIPARGGHRQELMVVGGGVAGLTAALEAAKTGYEVRLVEKSDRSRRLAGQAAQVRFQPGRPLPELEDTGSMR